MEEAKKKILQKIADEFTPIGILQLTEAYENLCRAESMNREPVPFTYNYPPTITSPFSCTGNLGEVTGTLTTTND